jgi:hypothetical protein
MKRRQFHPSGYGQGLDALPNSPSPREIAMTGDKTRRVEVKDEDHTIAAAEVTPLDDSGGIVRTSVLPSSGHAPPGSRASLIDAVMDLPEVQDGSRLEATVPLGDTESLDRLRERTDETVTRPAGSTALVDGDIPAPRQHPGGAAAAEENQDNPPG